MRLSQQKATPSGLPVAVYDASGARLPQPSGPPVASSKASRSAQTRSALTGPPRSADRRYRPYVDRTPKASRGNSRPHVHHLWWSVPTEHGSSHVSTQEKRGGREAERGTCHGGSAPFSLPSKVRVPAKYLASTLGSLDGVSDVERPDPWKPDLGDRVSRLKAFKVGNVPPPVIARAEQLCDLVDEADGIRPDRQTLIAALVYAAKPNGHHLAQIWQEYRTAPVHALLLGEENQSGLVDLTRYTKSRHVEDEG
jgi:hypothetical protein